MCAKVIFVISVILCVMGLFSGLYGYLGIDINATMTLGDQKIPSPTALFGMLAIVVGIFTFVVGLLGLCAAKWKKCCFTMPFCIFSFILFIVMLVVAFIGILLSSRKDELYASTCASPVTGKHSGDSYATFTDYMKSVYDPAVNDVMCTAICPCVDTHKSLFAGKQSSKITPMWVPTSATLNKIEGPFDNFKACYDTKLKTAYAASNEGSKKEFSNEGFEMFSKLETDMNCSGLCYKPVFGITRNLAKGPVKNECIGILMDALSTLMAPAVVCLITALILMCAVCGSIPLCSGFNEQDDDMMGEP